MSFKDEVDRERLFEIVSQRKEMTVDSWEDFEELETQDKRSLLKNSENDVLFDTDEKVLGGQVTSGTSGRMAAITKTKKDYEKEKQHNDLRLSRFFDKDSRVMVLIRSSWGQGILRDLREKEIFAKMGEPYDLNQSVEIVENMEIDSVFSNPSHALHLGRKLDGPERERFQYLVLGGSSLSEPARKELREKFPNATIFRTYGSTESGSVAFQDEEIAGSNKYLVDTENHYVEILDEDGNPVEEGEGEITITNIWEGSGIPITRYRTGDRGAVVKEDGRTLLKVFGRMKFDSVKIGGLSVYSENFEKAMDEARELLKPEYQIIVEEDSDGEKTRPYLRVKALPRTGFTKDDLVRARTADILMKNFQITPEKSWKDLVEEQVFGEIELELVKENHFEGKTPEIIDKRN